MNGCAGEWCGVGYDGNGHTAECAAASEKQKTKRCRGVGETKGLCRAKVKPDEVFCDECADLWEALGHPPI